MNTASRRRVRGLRGLPAKLLERRIVRLLDAVLAALYTITFGLIVYIVTGDLATASTLAAIEALLYALGWRNIPIHVGRNVCILYRSGFIPLYTALFTATLWLYYHAPDITIDAAVASIAVLLALYALYRFGGEAAIRATLVAAFTAGLIVSLTCSARDAIALAFSVSQIAPAAAKPRILCDDRPILMAAGLYAAIGYFTLRVILHAL